MESNRLWRARASRPSSAHAFKASRRVDLPDSVITVPIEEAIRGASLVFPWRRRQHCCASPDRGAGGRAILGENMGHMGFMVRAGVGELPRHYRRRGRQL
jgi:hypothetical protein